MVNVGAIMLSLCRPVMSDPSKIKKIDWRFLSAKDPNVTVFVRAPTSSSSRHQPLQQVQGGLHPLNTDPILADQSSNPLAHSHPPPISPPTPPPSHPLTYPPRSAGAHVFPPDDTKLAPASMASASSSASAGAIAGVSASASGDVVALGGEFTFLSQSFFMCWRGLHLGIGRSG